MRRALIGAGLVLAILIVQNVVFFVRNQGQECAYTICVGPRTVGAMALRNVHPVARGRIAVYYALAKDLHGAELVIPKWLEGTEWELERITGVDVVGVRKPQLVEQDQVDELRRRAISEHIWLRTRKGKRGKWQTFYVLPDEGQGPYVMGETGKTLGPVFIMRESELAKVARGSSKGARE